MPLLEICCFSADSAIVAAGAGADRIELCDGQEVGGTTPPLQSLQRVKQHATATPVNVMIRPRGGNFCYSDADFAQMLTDVQQYKADADGFVFGVLDAEGRVDVSRTTALVRCAAPRPCTFHRAMDEARDLDEALEHILNTGCRTILTSGGAPTAVLGSAHLKRLVDKAQGKIDIMPGGGVRASNIEELHAATGAPYYHSSATKQGAPLPDANEIRSMRASINKS